MTTAQWIILICAVITGLASTIVVFRKSLQAFFKWNLFVSDWFGEPERPGSPARPALTERVATLETQVKEIREEFKNNGGSSLRDAIDRIERKIDGYTNR